VALPGQWLLQGREKAKMEMVVTNKQEERMNKRQIERKQATAKMTSRPSTVDRYEHVDPLDFTAIQIYDTCIYTYTTIMLFYFVNHVINAR